MQQQQQKYPLQFWKYQLQDFNSNVLVIAFALSWTTFNLFSKTSWNSIFCWIMGKNKRHQEEIGKLLHSPRRKKRLIILFI